MPVEPVPEGRCDLGADEQPIAELADDDAARVDGVEHRAERAQRVLGGLPAAGSEAHAKALRMHPHG